MIAAALALLVAAIAAAHLAWFHADRRIPFWDQYRYYAITHEAAAILEGRSPRPATDLLDLHPSHPPLYPLLGVAPMLLLGDGWWSARLLNVALAALLALAAFGLARRWLEPWPSVGAAFLACALPLGVTMTHLYYIENLLAVLVVASLHALVASRGFLRLGPTILFGILAGLGCLAKWTFPLFLWLPAVLGVVRYEHFRKAILGALLALAITLAIAAPWYIAHADGIVDFFSGGVTGGEGHLSGVEGLRGVAYYPKVILLAAAGIPVCAFAFLGLRRLARHASWQALVYLFAIVAPIAVFSFVLTKKPRHILPMLPLLGILAAGGIAGLRPRALRAGAFALVALHLVLASAQLSFGVPSESPELRAGGVSLPLLARTHNDDPGPPDATAWPHGAIVDAITKRSPEPDAKVLVAFNLVGFRDVGFQWVALERGLRLRFGILPLHFPGWRLSDGRFPLLASSQDDWTGLADADYLIAKGGRMWVKVQSGEAVHLDAARVSEALMDPYRGLGALFVEQGRFVLPDGSTARVFAAAKKSWGWNAALAEFALRFDPDDDSTW